MSRLTKLSLGGNIVLSIAAGALLFFLLRPDSTAADLRAIVEAERDTLVVELDRALLQAAEDREAMDRMREERTFWRAAARAAETNVTDAAQQDLGDIPVARDTLYAVLARLGPAERRFRTD